MSVRIIYRKPQRQAIDQHVEKRAEAGTDDKGRQQPQRMIERRKNHPPIKAHIDPRRKRELTRSAPVAEEVGRSVRFAFRNGPVAPAFFQILRRGEDGEHRARMDQSSLPVRASGLTALAPQAPGPPFHFLSLWLHHTIPGLFRDRSVFQDRSDRKNRDKTCPRHSPPRPTW